MNEATVTILQEHIASKILRQPGKLIQTDTHLISGGLIDSFSLVDLALFVEDTFGVRIEDTELNAQTFDSLDQLAEIIATRQPK